MFTFDLSVLRTGRITLDIEELFLRRHLLELPLSNNIKAWDHGELYIFSSVKCPSHAMPDASSTNLVTGERMEARRRRAGGGISRLWGGQPDFRNYPNKMVTMVTIISMNRRVLTQLSRTVSECELHAYWSFAPTQNPTLTSCLFSSDLQ